MVKVDTYPWVEEKADGTPLIVWPETFTVDAAMRSSVAASQRAEGEHLVELWKVAGSPTWWAGSRAPPP